MTVQRFAHRQPAQPRPTNRDARPGFLIILFGGTGLAAGRYINPFPCEPRPFPMTVIQLDTDPISAPWVDQFIDIHMTADKINALVANPTLFGREASLIVQHHQQLLDPEDIGNGSRTIRLLSQLAFIYHEPKILANLRQAILKLQKQQVTSITPVFLSSTGGGAGSALQVLLAHALWHARFRNRLLEGLQVSLKTPYSFVVEPFAYALRLRESQANMVLANAFAFRLESAALLVVNALKYVYHIGFSNSAGVVLDTPDEIAKVLGTSVYEFLRNWESIKSFTVNNADTNRMVCRYAGLDVPEILRARRNTPAAVNGHSSSSPNGTAASTPS